MKTTLWNLLFLTVVMALSTHNARSQVTIGGLTDPRAGAILDLNSDTKGGLLLPNIDIPDLSKIPATGFLGIDAEQDTNLDLAGTIVYNTNTTTGPGVFLWCGHNWNRLGKAGALIVREDPGNINPFPADGSKVNSYTVDNHTCSQAGIFTFSWVAGEEFIDLLSILDDGAGTFTVKFLPNDQAIPRHAVLLITDACGNSNTFVFTQSGDATGCGTSPPVPDPQPGNTLTLCSGGAVYLHLDGHTDAGVYIWTLNGQEVGRGHDYVATQPGRYIVYADKIGCSNSKEVMVTASNALAPEAPLRIIVTNNGLVCGPTGTTPLVVDAPSASTVAWYKNSMKQTGLSSHTINAGVGVWWAVVEDGNCSSKPSDKVYIYADNSGSAIPAPTIKINGQTGSNVRLCQSGSAYLEVVNYDPHNTYTWYADNTQIGTGTGVYYQIPPGAPSVVLRVRVTGVGCASESNANVMIESGSTPAIPVIAGRSSLCGGNTTLTLNTALSSPVITWFKDGAILSGETGINLLVTEPGNYSATVANNGCVSPMSAVRPVTLSDFAQLSWIKAPADANFGDQRTLEVSGTNGPLTYTWTITRDDGSNEDLTSTVIQSGQGTSQVLVEYPQAGGSSSEDFIISVRGVNACGLDATDLKKNITLTAQCSAPKVTYPVSDQNMDVLIGNMVILNVTASNLNNATYKWFKGTKGSATQIVGASSATLVYTPTQSGKETLWCQVSNGCGLNYTDDSPYFYVTAGQNPENMAVGSGSLTGKVCFDIAESNFGGVCGMSDGRISSKANFAAMSNQDKTYTFTAKSTGTNFRFVVVDPEQVLDETTPYTAKNNFADDSFVSGNTATIVLNFKTNLNSTGANPLIVGRTRDQAAQVKLYAVWTTGSVDYAIPLTVRIQDCQCCGALISPTEWRAFMCHNLGADQSLPPFTPSKGLIGNYYQWGKKTPIANANTPASAIPGWNNNGYNKNGWSDASKLPDDPCPAGWRIPTESEWTGVRDNNTFSYITGNGYGGLKIGTSMFLPNAGIRSALTSQQIGNGVLYDLNNFGYYWSSSKYIQNGIVYDTNFRTFVFNTLLKVGIGSYLPGHAESVRCISEN